MYLNIQTINILKHKTVLYLTVAQFFGFFKKFLTVSLLKLNDPKVELCVDAIRQKLIYGKYFPS